MITGAIRRIFPRVYFCSFFCRTYVCSAVVLVVFVLMQIGIIAVSENAVAQQRKLVVYTYDSFVVAGGLGDTLKPMYEERCNCEVEYRTFADAGTILNTLRLEKTQSEADVVIGLDNNMSAQAKRFFRPHGLGGDYGRLFDLPVKWVDSVFVPFDYGWFAFVYNKKLLPNAPQSFDELLASDLRLIIQDPRTSSPGLGLLLWVKKLYGDDAERVWKNLFNKIVTVTKGWSEAYGLFLQGEADMVLSYNTSPAYHLLQEKNTDYRAAIFEDGLFLQIELGAIAKTSKQPELAKDFLRFIISPTAQRMVATGNWMFPILGKSQQVEKPQIFEDIREKMRSVPTLTIASGKVLQQRRVWIAEWREAGF